MNEFRRYETRSRVVRALTLIAWMGCTYDYSALGGRAGRGGTPTDAGAANEVGSGGRMTSTGGSGTIAGGGAAAGNGVGTGMTGGRMGAGSGGAQSGTGGEDSGRNGGAGGSGASGGRTEPGSGGQTAGAAGASPPAFIALSIDFIGGRSPPSGAGGADLISSHVMSPAEIAGVKPAAHWNGAMGAMGALTNLVLSNGVATPAVVTWRSSATAAGPGVWDHNYADAEGDVRMMNGYLDPLTPATPATVVVADLPVAITAAGYDVYLYVSGDIRSNTTRTSLYSVGTTAFTASEMGPTSAFAGFILAGQGGFGNYVVFKNQTSASFTLIATPGTTTPSRAPLNGIQIVSPAGS